MITLRSAPQFRFAIASAIILLVGGGNAFAGLMYGLGALPSNNTRLFEVVNYSSPSPSINIIGSTGRVLGDLAISSSGTIYTVATVASGSTPIFTVNPNTAALSGPIFTLGASGMNSLAWMPGDILFTYGYQSGNVWRIDLVSNTASILTTLPANGADLAWDPTDGFLYASTLNQRLYKIDPNTGTFTLQGVLNLGGTNASIAIDYTGQMYATTALDNSAVLRYYTVNKSNASTTLIADFTGLGLGSFGLGAASFPIPEPSSLMLVVLGSMCGLIVKRALRRKLSGA